MAKTKGWQLSFVLAICLREANHNMSSAGLADTTATEEEFGKAFAWTVTQHNSNWQMLVLIKRNHIEYNDISQADGCISIKTNEAKF